MAEESPVQNLCDEATCPICLEYFKDPVIIDCGHIFCQACITQCWGDPEKDVCCPQCREPCQQRNFKPNRQLASIVEIAKKFSLQMAKGAEALGRVCQRHQEPLKLFCEDDQAPICMVCDRSKEHRGHKVIPKEEAFEEYKDKIMSHLKFLNNEREEILSFKLTSETETQDLLEKTERERQKIVAEFKQLHQFLEEQEKFLISRLKDLEDEIKCCKDGHIARLSEEMSSMDSLIKEMEEKQKQTVNEFLQDLKNLLQRCNKEKFVNPVTILPEKKRRIDNFFKIHPSLETAMKNFKDTVLFTLQENKEMVAQRMSTPKLVLASSTYLTASGFSNNSFRTYGQFSRSISNNSTSNTYLHYCWSTVTGTERITSGCHSWVVNVGTRKFWTVGVASEKNKTQIWAVGKLSPTNNPQSDANSLYCAFASPELPPHQFWVSGIFTKLELSHPTQNICVSLNYEQGSVTFSNADDGSTIYTFKDASFCKEELCSYFSEGIILA